MADEYETKLISETDTEIRIRAIAVGNESELELNPPAQRILLSQPLGDRIVIDDTRDRIATLVPA